MISYVALQKIRQFVRNPWRELRYACAGIGARHAIGSSDWLISTEKHFGGYVTGVARRAVSPSDPRSKEQVAKGGMTGGDRMFHHGYARVYADALASFIARRHEPLTVVEVGILKGTGLATWSVLFPNADIIGLDIDLSNTQENIPRLKTLGAFQNKAPELHIFDQLEHGAERMAEILNGRSVDIFIDDGLHSDESILNTARAIFPHLSDEFVGFIEDNKYSRNIVSAEPFPWSALQCGELCVITPSKSC